MGKQSKLLLQPTAVELGLQVGVEFGKIITKQTQCPKVTINIGKLLHQQLLPADDAQQFQFFRDNTPDSRTNVATTNIAWTKVFKKVIKIFDDIQE